MRAVRAVFTFACVLMGLVLAGCGPAPRGAAVAPAGQLARTIVPQNYALAFTIDPKEEYFSGHAEVDVVLKERGRRIIMHGSGLHVSQVFLQTADGAKVRASYREVLNSGVAQIDLERAAGPGAAKLIFDYTARFNENLAGLYRVEQGGLWYAMTQFEATDARKAFPSFDEPGFKTPFSISITAPAGQTVVSNSPEIKKLALPAGQERHVFGPTPPLPTYLIAMAVGPYDVVQAPSIPANDVRRNAVPLRGIAAKGKGAQLSYALTRTAPIMAALEDYFGVPYPYAKLDLMAAPDFDPGAMENAGLIAFREQILLLNDESGTTRKRDFLLTASHELAHQWFGNLVTPRWWDDIWLNEAFATWMEAKIANKIDPAGDYLRGVQRDAISAMELDGLAAVRRVREPILRTEDARDAFDPITYQKGGAVLAMFERYLGEDAFRAGVRRHMERFANDSATSDDFFLSLAQGSHRPEVAPAFKSFIDRQGIPVVSATPACGDPVAGPQITMRQSRYAPLGSKITVGEPWIVPACFAGLSSSGRRETCALLDRLEQNVQVPSCPAIVLPNVGGQAYYRLGLNTESAAALLKMRAALSGGEMLSLTESLDAAYRAGSVDAATYLDGMRIAASSAAWDVATYPSGLDARRGVNGPLESLVNSLAPDARPQYAALMRAMYASRLQGVFDARDGSSALLRMAAIDAVAVQGGDPDMRRALAERVLPALGFPAPDGGAQPLDEDMRKAALTVAIQDGGKPVLDAVLIALKTAGDQSFRRDAVEAIGQVQDKAMVAQVLRGALEQPFSGAETYDLAASLLANPYAKDATWSWLKKNYANFAQRIPESRKAEAPWLTRWFCTEGAAEDVARFFERNASAYRPSPRMVAMGVEKIRLCAVLKKARGAEFRAALLDAAAPLTGTSPSAPPPSGAGLKSPSKIPGVKAPVSSAPKPAAANGGEPSAAPAAQ